MSRPRNIKPYHDHMLFQWKRIWCSLPLQLTKFVIVSMIITTLLVFHSFVFSMEGNIENKNSWMNSENIIVTQPLDNTLKRGDLYDPSDIQKVKDSVKGVIGYQVGWVASHISFNDSMAIPMNIDDLKDAIVEEENKHKETGAPYSRYYEEMLHLVEQSNEYEKVTGNKQDPNRILGYDYRAYEGFSTNQQGSVQYLNQALVPFGNYQDKAAIYQMFDMKKLDLKYGTYPTRNNEVIINMDMAENLRKAMQLTSVESLFNEVFTLNLSNEHYALVQVSGIAYQENEYENRIYFDAGKFDQIMRDVFHFNEDQLKYAYVYFICDASYDGQSIANEINLLLGSQYSKFIAFPDSILNDTTVEKASYSALSYIVIGVLVVVVSALYLLVLFLQRKQYNKEIKLLKHYGKSISLYILLPLFLIYVLDAFIFTLAFQKICELVNMVANQLGYLALIQNTPLVLIASLVLSMVITLMMEGAFYVYQTRKHRKNLW